MARLVVLGPLSIGVALMAHLAYVYIAAMQHLKLPTIPEPVACPSLDEQAAIDRFRRLITYPSVSNASAPHHVNDPQVFHALHVALSESYPAVWQHLEVEQVGSNGLSLLFTWRGSDPSLRPVLFVSHLDVVPVTPGSEGDWRHPPFGGELAEGFVWGRGASDIKFSVAALLETVNGLLSTHWVPRRTLMFAFGQDEEVGGALGAGVTSALLAARGVELEVVVDEGGLVLLDGLPPFTSAGRQVALVGTAEKGYASLQVTLHSPGGHSSMPPTDGSDIASQIWRLTTALRLLAPAPALAPPVTHMLSALAPFAPKWMGPLMVAAEGKRSWLLNKMLALLFRHGLSRETAAMVSNTLALTRIAGGVADNVLPQEAVLGFNARLLPGSSPQDVVDQLQRAAALGRVGGAEVLLKQNASWAASTVAHVSGRHYQLLARAIRETWREEGQADIVVAPMLLTGGTDSKHYAALSRGGILRFVPYGMNKSAGDVGLIHATNERIRAGHLVRAVCTYSRVMQLMAGEEGEGQ